MKKVLFLIYDLSHGGAEKVLVNLVNNMDANKYDITVMTIINTGVHIKNLNPNIKYKYIFPCKIRGISKILKLFSPQKLFKKFIKEDYDILVAYLEGAPARIISGCNDSNIKKVAWIHIQMDKEPGLKVGFRDIEEAQNAYKKFDKIVCVSKDVKDTFNDCMENKIDIENIDILYNTNETDYIKNKSLEKIDDVFFDTNMVNICSVGKIIKAKGFDRLARVHKKLIEEGYLHHIYILGVGDMKNEIEKYLTENGLRNSFKFIGYRENPYKYVAACDIYICSSYKEGFSTAVTESLIVGTPVISTKCSGVEELLGVNNDFGLVVNNNENGIYEGLKKMLKDKDLRISYESKCCIRAQKFSKTKTVKAVEDMFESLCK